VVEGLHIMLRQHGPIALDVDIAILPGQTLALVGASGAGKTTILRAVAGLYRPQHARIACNGISWLDTAISHDMPARLRRAGLVFQEYALFPHLTVLENVMEAALELPRYARTHKGMELLSRVHLTGCHDSLPHNLSGGQRQRVALARALARDPAVLLLDEPFSAVDHPTRRALHRLLAEIRETSPIPIIVVSHDVEDAARSADQLCFIQDGSSVEIGPTRALLNEPSSHIAKWLAL